MNYLYNEIWLPIDSPFERYKVSNLGRVKSDDDYWHIEGNRYGHRYGKILKSIISKLGYVKANVSDYNGTRKLISVHRLVAKAFIPNPENKPQVNHINGIKYDNRVENLEWCTQKENVHHAIKIGLYVTNQHGEGGSAAKLNNTIVLTIREMWSSKKHKQKDIAKYFNISHKLVNQIVLRKTWKLI